MSMPGCTLEPSVGKVFLFSLVIPRFGVLSHVSSLRLSSGHLGPVLTLRTSDAACAFHPALLAGAGCKSLGYFSAGSCGYACILCVCVCVCVCFPPGYVALWDSKTPHRPTCGRVSYWMETSPSSQLPQDRSLSLSLLSPFFFFFFFGSFIFFPTTFPRESAAFLGTWYPPPTFKSCFLKVAQHSNELMVNF